MRIVFLMVTIYFSSVVFAGGVVGNGGDGIVCKDKSSVELLDYYEAKTIRNLTIDLGPESWSVAQKVQFTLIKLSKFDPERAGRYWKRAQLFWTEAQFVPNANLVDIPDSQHILVPIGCEIKQIAIQKRPEFKLDPYYVIDLTLWERLSKDHQAGLILHELIYRELQSENSKPVRYFNGIISSNEFFSLSPIDYVKIQNEVELSYFFYWKDPESGLWWNRVGETSDDNYTLSSIEKKCSKLGGRLPTKPELENAYSKLSQARYSLLGWKYELMSRIPIYFDIKKNIKMVYLNENKYSEFVTENDKKAFKNELFCIFSNDPWPVY